MNNIQNSMNIGVKYAFRPKKCGPPHTEAVGDEP